MSGRSTPLSGYPEQYRPEGRMGWLAAFGTAGYPDGIPIPLVVNFRTTTLGRIRREFWTYKNKSTSAKGMC